MHLPIVYIMFRSKDIGC